MGTSGGILSAGWVICDGEVVNVVQREDMMVNNTTAGYVASYGPVETQLVRIPSFRVHKTSRFPSCALVQFVLVVSMMVFFAIVIHLYRTPSVVCVFAFV